MSSKEYNNLLKIFDQLSSDEKTRLVDKIVTMMNGNDRKDISFENDLTVKKYSRGDRKPDCPHCKSKADLGFILKKGFQNNTQRYYCKNCNRYFVATTNTVFENTRKGKDTWEKFIELTISGKSLAVCAEECELCTQTAFTWRHKILNAFRVHQDSTKLSGRIEMDEMLIPISYKGNHIKGCFLGRRGGPGIDNNLPRKSFKRGTDNKSTSSKDKACVCCMTKNGNEGFFAVVPGVGFMKKDMLDNTLAKHVDKDNSIVLADQYKTTWNYLRDNEYQYMILSSNTTEFPHDHKPEIRDGYHLQHVNAFHHHLRKFLATYCGVSSKYLENYVSLYVWLKNIAANKQKKQLKKISIRRAASADCYISRTELEAKPLIPKCA